MTVKGQRQKPKIKKAALLFLSFVFGFLPLAFAQDELWQTAKPPYDFDVARDQASHPDYRVEQWAYSGNLFAADGRRFGYQLKFVRAGVSFKPENPSRWAVRDLFVTQLAVTDVEGKRFVSAERINRSGINWAGASPDDLHLWNDDWEVRQDKNTVTLRAADEENGRNFGIELSLEQGRSLVAHGEEGVFQKGFLPINASHFYSQPRMPTHGFLSLDGKQIEVTGTSWLDREFGTSFLEEAQSGWDVFTIQLDDGTDLMIYQIRLADGTRDEYSIATIVQADGSQESLKSEQFELEPITRWSSPASGGIYPIHWRVKIPGKQIELEIKAAMEDQERRAGQSVGVNYWKGAVDANGICGGRAVKGGGFLEMTGYASAAQ